MLESEASYREQATIKTNRSVLALKVMNSSAKEGSKVTGQRVSTYSRANRESKENKENRENKENTVKLSAFNLGGDSKLTKKSKLSVTSKPSKPKPLQLQSVAIIQSDEEECF